MAETVNSMGRIPVRLLIEVGRVSNKGLVSQLQVQWVSESLLNVQGYRGFLGWTKMRGKNIDSDRDGPRLLSK